MNIIEKFFIKNIYSEINKTKMISGIKTALEKAETNFDILEEIDEEFFKSIFINLYDVNKPISTLLNNKLREKGYYIGAKGKKSLKLFLDYRMVEYLEEIKEIDKNAHELVNKFIEENNLTKDSQFDEAKKIAISLFESSKSENDLNDKIIAIYSAITHYVEKEKKYFLVDIFFENEEEIVKELGKKYSNIFLNKLKTLNYSGTRRSAAQFFSHYFVEVKEQKLQDERKEIQNKKNIIELSPDGSLTDLKKVVDEDLHLIYIKVNQWMYDLSNNYEEFIDNILFMVEECYRVLKNHRNFTVNIEDIYDTNKKNLKWDIYSKIVVYAENFRREAIEGKYYRPSQLFFQYLTHKYKKNGLSELEIEKLYIENDKKKIMNFFEFNFPKEDIQEIEEQFNIFKKIFTGFTYLDCILINKKEESHNELFNYSNSTSLLLIFEKNKLDLSKTPCPSCGSLKISGNSFPKIGIRSWECKNPICPDRSKSNRGKRYSQKTNLMQLGYEKNEDTISSNIINIWKKDTIFLDNDKKILEMLLSYYSFSGDNILIINPTKFDEQELLNFGVSIRMWT